MRAEELRELYRGGRPNGRARAIRNLEASGGRALWEQGIRRDVTLLPVPVEQRALLP